MKSLFILVITAFISSALFAQTETRNLSDFTSISVSAGIEVYLDSDQKNFAVVTVEKTDLDDLITEVKNGTLVIKWKKDNVGWSKREAEVVLHYTNIEGIDASSGATVEGDDILESNRLKISTSSGANIELKIKTTDLSVDVSSGAAVTLSGSTNSQDVDVSSGASYKAGDLISSSADVDGSSGAMALIHTTQKLSADVSSGAVIKYKGNPTEKDLDQDKWSGGVIRKN